MAQASSAQREPSMEEILASIRRIIEDSDQGKKPSDPEQPQRFEPSSERGDGAVIEVDAFRAELRGRTERDLAPHLSAPVSKEDRRPTTLGDVQVKIASEAPPAYQAEPAYAAEPPASTGETMAYQAAPAAEAEETDVGTASEPTGPDVELDEAELASATAAAQQSSYQAPRPAIISEQAGRQVAAAFGELSEAFAASRRKSFDEMAEEMLRPMLQDWLDNNLPVLVERLVREEIERVARGV